MMKLDLTDLSSILDVVINLVKTAESLWSDYNGAGEAKKEFCVQTLNTYIDVPLLGEGLEGKIIGIIVDIVVEFVINNAQ